MSNINLFAELDEDQGQAHGQNNGHHEHKDDDLIVFGYSCKLFRDDFSAKAIDRGQSLIPWNGDENVMIDRYDCRGHLFDLTPWDSDLLRNRHDEQPGNKEDKHIEEECERERYVDLYRDLEKEALLQEEASKRLCVDKSTYQQVGYSYDDTNTSKETVNKTTEEVLQPVDDDDEYEPFYPSEKLQLPYGMDIPESIKLNAVIEKTANFVSTAGLQMEIVVKTKQASNRQFDFLKYDHYLNPYYRHLIIMIKSGKYRSNVDGQSTNTVKKKKGNKNGSSTIGVDPNSSHEDEDEGNDSYLHPLLRGGSNKESNQANKKSEEVVRTPSVPMNIHNTAYGQLIKKYEHLRQREKVAKEAEEEKLSPTSDEMKNEESSPRSESSPSTHVIPPPPDVKPIIDKLAEYVARNGSTFEESIRTKNDPRFGFLERDHIHYNYFQLKVQLSSQEIQRKALEESQRRPIEEEDEQQQQQRVQGSSIKLVLKSNVDESLTPTSCREFQSDDDSNSMPQNEQDDNGEFIGPRPPSPDFLEKMRKQEQRRDRVNDFVREKLVRDKQEERKRKAEMLVQQLKTKTTEPPVPADSPTVNPILVEKFLNVKTERTSSTVLPPSSHRSSSRSHSKYRRRSRSKSSHRRTRRTSHKRSRSRSKSRSHYRSKRSKNSKSNHHHRAHRQHRHHRRQRHSSSVSNSSSSVSGSRSSSSSFSSSTDEGKKKKKIKNEPEVQQQQQQTKKTPLSTKWDQREPTKVKNDPVSVATDPSLSLNNETTVSNSTS